MSFMVKVKLGGYLNNVACLKLRIIINSRVAVVFIG